MICESFSAVKRLQTIYGLNLNRNKYNLVIGTNMSYESLRDVKTPVQGLVRKV